MIRRASNSGPAEQEVAAPSAGSPRARSAALLRPIEPEDAEAVHALLTRAIPDVLTDRQRWLARWRWQYWENPYRQDRPAGWVLANGGGIVGHLGAVHVPLRVGAARMPAVIGADYAVADDAVARDGVFAGLQLAEAFFSAAQESVALATTANEKTGAVFSRFGCRPVAWTREFWRAPTTLTQQVRAGCGTKSRIARRLLAGRVGSALCGALGRCCRWLHHAPAIPIPAGCRLETTVPQLAGDLGWIWEGFAWQAAVHDHTGPPGERTKDGNAGPGEDDGPGMVSIDRTQAYWRWRYTRHPERDNVRVLVVRDGDGLPIGVAVVFLDERERHRIAFVEELITLPGRLDVMRTLLCAAIKLAYDHEADYLVTTPGRRPIRHVFRELGFESRARSAPAVVIRPPGGSAAAGAAPDLFGSIGQQLDFWHGEMF